MLEAAAEVARKTGCTVELPAKGGGVVRIVPPGEKPAHPATEPKPW
jgi:hypothetical protein